MSNSKPDRRLFGTDGIRGKANSDPMSAGIALRLGQAAGLMFVRGDHRHRVVIGKDTRLSGYLLEPWSGIPPGRLQAIDLRGTPELGSGTRRAYELVRSLVPFTARDDPPPQDLQPLVTALSTLS